MALSGKAMTDALAARGQSFIGQAFSQNGVAITLLSAISVQGPFIPYIYGPGAALIVTMNASVNGVSKVDSGDRCVLMAHEIADMTTAEQTAYLKARLAAFIGV